GVRLYQPMDRAKLAQGRIASFTESKIRYETKRAMQKGMSLEQWVESRLPVDPLSALIDAYIRICDEMDTLMVPDRSYGCCRCTNSSRYIELEDEAWWIEDRFDRYTADLPQ